MIVTDTLGDILTDLGGAVSGGIGLAARPTSTPIARHRRCSTGALGPDIAGQTATGRGDPVGGPMLEFLADGEPEDTARAERIAACAEPVTGSTTEVGTAIADRVQAEPMPITPTRRSG